MCGAQSVLFKFILFSDTFYAVHRTKCRYIDGQINNATSVDELEAKVKAGEQISRVDLAEAIKNDKAATKSEPKKPGRKPSIRKQLKEDKENEKKEPKNQATKTKNKELEV